VNYSASTCFTNSNYCIFNFLESHLTISRITIAEMLYYFSYPNNNASRFSPFDAFSLCVSLACFVAFILHHFRKVFTLRYSCRQPALSSFVGRSCYHSYWASKGTLFRPKLMVKKLLKCAKGNRLMYYRGLIHRIGGRWSGGDCRCWSHATGGHRVLHHWLLQLWLGSTYARKHFLYTHFHI